MSTDPSSPAGGLLDTRRWLIYLLPMIVFMAVGSLEPVRSGDDNQGGGWFDLGIEYRHYPLVYTAKIGLTLAAMLLVLPGYRQFAPFRVSLLAPLVGLVGIVVWVGLASLHLEEKLLEPLGLGWLVNTGQRSGFNPLVELAGNPAWAHGFLAIRLLGLVVVVAVIEEFFLRGFVMRFAVDPDTWWKVPFGRVTPLAVAVGTILPMLMHPGELLAAAVWFSMVTWLMVRTRNIWDCVAAHAVTNLALGIYVIAQDEWWLM